MNGWPLNLCAVAAAGCLGTPSPLAPGLGGSVGLPHHGVLTEAVELPASGAGFVRYRPQGSYYWGTPELVGLIEEASLRVAREMAAAPPLVVGDLSGRDGGRIERHQSHRTGRDVDLLFYVTTPAGAPVPSPGFVRFGPDGLAWVGAGQFVRFDVPRNWLLVKTLLASRAAGVQRIYVSRALEALLTDYARAREEDQALLWHAVTVLAQPGDSSPHDDHFHLRVACAPERAVQGCEGGGPQWEWLPAPPELATAEGESSAEELFDEPWSELLSHSPSEAPAWRGPFGVLR